MPISGTEFKKLYPNTTFYKLTNTSENHHNFQFKDGLNIDINTFDPSLCCNGGLYFTELNNIGHWITYTDIRYIREVEIVDDSLVCIEKRKFKTNKFILKERILLKDFVFWNYDDFCLAAVKQNGDALQLVKNQTEEICLAAVKRNGYALKYVHDQTEEICLAAVTQNGYALGLIKNQTKEICLAAVEQFGYALEYVHNQTEEICLAAVKQNGNALLYVKNQTKEICTAAINKNPGAYKYIKIKMH